MPLIPGGTWIGIAQDPLGSVVMSYDNYMAGYSNVPGYGDLSPETFGGKRLGGGANQANAGAGVMPLPSPWEGSRTLGKVLGAVGRGLNIFFAASLLSGDTPVPHRGRIQAQGGGLEASVSWAQRTPPTTAEGLAMVESLRTQLTTRQINERSVGFTQAERFISNAGNAGGVDAPVSRSFPPGNAIRVDIEVITGRAFVP